MKTLIVNFSIGERYRIDLKIIASLIANEEFENGSLQGYLKYSNRKQLSYS